MRVRIGLVGAGSAALRAHLPALTRAAEADAIAVVGVVDPEPARREEVAQRCPGARGFVDIDELLEATTPDLLVIASPPSSHLAAVQAAFAHEVDVVCEKPLGVARGDVAALEALAAAHPQRFLAPVHQYRFAPAWERFQATVAAAADGHQPFALAVEVERPGTDPLSAGGWRATGLREGGILGDHGVHYLALCWTLDPSASLTTATVSGEPGHESATMEVRLAGGHAHIDVSYAGTRRRNLVELSVSGGSTLRWLDGELTTVEADEPGEACPTAALSDRQAVNDLYWPLYDELLAQRGDAAWRATRTAETLAVARMLETALDAVR